jgi:DNA invertase Pin-like site-specific DNA recombinase
MSNNEFPAFVARAYGRASSDGQTMSTDQQHQVCKDVFDLKKRIHQEWANATWGGFFADEATCRETSFKERHFGSMVLAATKPGDRIMCSHHDRLGCGVLHTYETFKLAREMQFRIVMGDREVDPSDPMHMVIENILSSLAEYELHRIRQRTKAALDHRKRLGKPCGRAPIGWRTVQCLVEGITKPQKFFVPDHKARRLAKELVAIKEGNGLTYTAACDVCNKAGRKQLNKRRWTHPTFIAWCRAAEDDFVLPNGSHDALPIPPNAKPIQWNTISEEDD